MPNANALRPRLCEPFSVCVCVKDNSKQLWPLSITNANVLCFTLSPSLYLVSLQVALFSYLCVCFSMRMSDPRMLFSKIYADFCGLFRSFVFRTLYSSSSVACSILGRCLLHPNQINFLMVYGGASAIRNFAIQTRNRTKRGKKKHFHFGNVLSHAKPQSHPSDSQWWKNCDRFDIEGCSLAQAQIFSSRPKCHYFYLLRKLLKSFATTDSNKYGFVGSCYFVFLMYIVHTIDLP